MKIFLLALAVILASTLRLDATMVRYVDESGKTIYLNTDNSKVPDRYLDQVRSQLNMIQPSIGEPLKDSSPTVTLLEPTQPIKVEVFISLNCPDCRDLEFRLRAHGIKYLRYDVNYHPYGIKFYKEQGQPGVPLAKIGAQIVQGNDYKRILSLVTPPKPMPFQSTATPTTTEP